MEIILPTAAQAEQINSQRRALSSLMERAPGAPLIVFAGPCAADSNLHSNGERAVVRHIKTLSAVSQEESGIAFFGRLNGTKPRTRGGTTGLLHQSDGVRCYGEIAQQLTQQGISLVAEVMDESDAAVASPWLTAKWIGARNVGDTGARQLMRPTADELAVDTVPAPVFVKNDPSGDLTTAIHAIHTIRSSQLERRLRFTLKGLQEVVTHANPHTGLILRGYAPRPEGLLDEILTKEILGAYRLTEAEFGPNTIPIMIDISHDHAKWEGGGEQGQLKIVQSLGRIMAQGIRIDGIMAETYLLAGSQPDSQKIPGLSQVDACIRESEAILLLKSLSEQHNYTVQN